MTCGSLAKMSNATRNFGREDRRRRGRDGGSWSLLSVGLTDLVEPRNTPKAVRLLARLGIFAILVSFVFGLRDFLFTAFF